MLSDGHANAGLRLPDELAPIAQDAASHGITTSTIGVGLGYDENLLDALTRGGNGNHRFAETADVAAAEIAQTVSDLLDVSVLAATPEGPSPFRGRASTTSVRQPCSHWMALVLVESAKGPKGTRRPGPAFP